MESGSPPKFGLFDENELNAPLVSSTHGIQGWEAWRAAVKAITAPSEEHLAELERAYKRACRQFELVHPKQQN